MLDRFSELEKQAIRSFKTPPEQMLYDFGKLMRLYFTPYYEGLENIEASKPALYVCNHSIYGITDGFLFVDHVYKQTGAFIRPMVDNTHYKIPVWRNVLLDFSVVRGSRENCALLMENNAHILVFPGGMREILKRKEEKNTTVWKNRTGFAAMAMQYGYDIIPVACYGGDEAFDFVVDGKDIQKSIIGKLFADKIEKWFKNGEHLPPIVKGLGPLPRPVNIYHKFGKRISTKEFQADYEDKEAQLKVRNIVEAEVQNMLNELKAAHSSEYEQQKYLTVSKEKNGGSKKSFLRKLLLD